MNYSHFTLSLHSPHTQPLHPAHQSSYATTGEPTDAANGLVYLRARSRSTRMRGWLGDKVRPYVPVPVQPNDRTASCTSSQISNATRSG
jgi:hypothetical protein